MRRALAVLTLLAACGPAAAQAPDCTGISVARPFVGVDYVNQLTAIRIVSGLESPVLVTSAPGDLDRLYVLQRAGEIRVVENGTLLATPFLDIDLQVTGSSNGSSNSEQGLLGLAFHPDYQSNGWFFVYFTDTSGTMRIMRYTALSPTAADPTSGATVATFPQPFSNHNGGTIAFGPDDGHLYIGTGDGGSGCDPGDRSQDLTSQPLGKLWRIDVDSLPYQIPPDNPFVGAAADDEIWAYGLRNPFRFSFDRIHGTLLIGDVGQNAREEINCVVGGGTGGENYGWKNFEGASCPNPSCGNFGCVISNHVPPVLDYGTSAGDSVIGGYVYRGCRMPELRGTYFWGNFSSFGGASDTNTELNSFRVDETDCSIGATTSRLADLKGENPFLLQKLTGFGEDQRGELYFVDMFDGELYKIMPNLRLLEVSGANAPPLTMGAADWAWEDLEAASDYPITSYKVFRSIGAPDGVFECAAETTGPAWTGGDPLDPAAGEVFFYVVQALNGSDRSYAGFRSDGTPRTVNNASVCPP